MVLQSTGAISLGNIQTEFQGSNPISLSEYYGVASGVPGSGSISISNFYGKSAAGTGRGVVGSGITDASTFFSTNTINYITIATTGNATDFGDLIAARGLGAGCSSSTRGLFAAGTNSNFTAVLTSVEYISIQTTGNARSFGNITTANHSQTPAGCSSNTRGIFAGGLSVVTTSNIVDYVTIATTGNAIDFGDLTIGRYELSACSSPTRGIINAGITSYAAPATAWSNIIDYVTIATTGNAIDFGDLVIPIRGTSSCSSSTRGVIAGGDSQFTQNTIQYVTIATTGNTTDFGDLPAFRSLTSATSNSTRGVFVAGFWNLNPTTLQISNVIEYITIATTGNAVDFGDLLYTSKYNISISDSHGGI